MLRARLPVALAREAVVSGPRFALVAGGMLAGDVSTAAAYRFDLRSHRVIALSSLPVAVHDTAGVALAGRALVIGGGNAIEQSAVQAWDGSTWRLVGHLPQARSDLVAAVVGRRILVVGGYDGRRVAEPGILASPDGRRWTTIGDLSLPVRYAASTVQNGALWLFGGERGGVEQTAIQRVDPETGRAAVVGHLPVRTGHAVAFSVGSRILVVGGRTSQDQPTDRMWWFDPSTGSITAAGRLPAPLADSAVASRGPHFFLLGGESPQVTDRVVEITAGR